jgi:hypothetical protein
MGPLEFAVAIFGGLILYCLVLPALGGGLMFKGLQAAGVENAPSSLCLRVAFASTYVAFFLVIINRYLPDSSTMEGRLTWAATLFSTQVVFVVILMRNYAPRVLLIEIGSFLFANAVTFGVRLLLSPVRALPVIE